VDKGQWEVEREPCERQRARERDYDAFAQTWRFEYEFDVNEHHSVEHTPSGVPARSERSSPHAACRINEIMARSPPRPPP
jgi:hypothetical protein